MNSELSVSSKLMWPFYINLLLIILMLFILIVSFVASSNIYLGKFDWLQRSGSIVVAVAVYLEFRHLNIFKNSASRSATIDGSLTFSGSKIIMNTYEVIWKINYFLLIIGTVVWGYGDIPFEIWCS